MKTVFKNLANSSKFLIKDLANAYIPDIIKTTTSLNDAIKESKSTQAQQNNGVKGILGSIKNQKHIKDITKMTSTFISNVKQGKFYTDPDDLSAMFGDDDMFDDLDNMFGDEDGAEIEIAETLGESVVGGAKLTANAVIESGEATARAVTSTAEATHVDLVANMRLMHAEQMKVNISMNDNLAKLVSFNDEINKKFVEQSLNFYKMSTEMQEDMHSASMDKLGDAYDRDGMKGWMKQVTEQLKDNADSKTGGAAGMIGGDMWDMIMGGYKGNMLKLGLDFGLVPALNKKFGLDSKLGRLNNSVLGKFSQGTQSIFGQMSNSDNAIIKGLGDALFNSAGDRAKVTATGVEDKKAIFSDVTRRSIEVVIPTYLRKIEAALTKGEESVYDYTTGKFKSVSQVKKEFDEGLPSFKADTDSISDSMLKKMQANDKIQNVDGAKLKKLVELAAMNLLTKGYTFDHLLGMTYKRYSSLDKSNMTEQEFYAVTDALAALKTSPEMSERDEYSELNNNMLRQTSMRRQYIADSNKRKNLTGLSSILDNSSSMNSGTKYKDYSEESLIDDSRYTKSKEDFTGTVTRSSNMSDQELEARRSKGILDYYTMASASIVRDLLPKDQADQVINKINDISKKGQEKGKAVASAAHDKFGDSLEKYASKVKGNSAFGKGIKHLSQQDPKLKNIAIGKSTISESGCGLLVTIMAMEKLIGGKVEIKDLLDLAKKYQLPNDGISFGMFTEAGTRYGVDVEVLDSKGFDRAKISSFLGNKSGMIFMYRVEGGYHYVFVDKVTGDTATVYDPHELKGETSRDINELLARSSHIITFKKGKSKSAGVITDNKGADDGTKKINDSYKNKDGSTETPKAGSAESGGSSGASGTKGGISIGSVGGNKKQLNALSRIAHNTSILSAVVAAKLGTKGVKLPKFVDFASGAGDKVKGAFAKISGIVKNPLKTAKESGLGLINKIKNLPFVKGLSKAFHPVKYAKDLLVKMKDRIANMKWRKNIFKKFSDYTSKRISMVKDSWAKGKAQRKILYNNMKKNAMIGAKATKELSVKLGKKVFELAKKGLATGGALLGAGFSKAKGMISKLPGKAKSLGSSSVKIQRVKVVGGKLDSVKNVGSVYAVGGVGQDMLSFMGGKDPSKINMAGSNVLDKIMKKRKGTGSVTNITNNNGAESKESKGILGGLMGFFTKGGLATSLKTSVVGMLGPLSSGIGMALRGALTGGAAAMGVFAASKLKETLVGKGIIDKDQADSTDKQMKLQWYHAANAAVKKVAGGKGIMTILKNSSFAKKIANMGKSWALKIGKKALGTASGLAKKALKYVKGLLMKILNNKTIQKKLGKKSFDKLVKNFIPKFMKKAASGMAGALAKSGKQLAALLPGIGTIIIIAFFISDFVSGWRNSWKLWGVAKTEQDHLSVKQKLITAFVKALQGLAASIPLFGLLFQFVPTSWLVSMVGNSILDDAELKDLEEKRHQALANIEDDDDSDHIKEAEHAGEDDAHGVPKDPKKSELENTNAHKAGGSSGSSGSGSSGTDGSKAGGTTSGNSVVYKSNGHTYKLKKGGDPVKNAMQMISKNEGFSGKAYKDSRGIWTIGHGLNLDQTYTKLKSKYVKTDANGKEVATDATMSKEESLQHKSEYIQTVLRKMNTNKKYANIKKAYDNSDDVRKSVLIDMMYNMGIFGLSKWNGTLGAMASGDYNKAADNILHSKYAKQVGARAINNANMIRNGNSGGSNKPDGIAYGGAGKVKPKAKPKLEKKKAKHMTQQKDLKGVKMAKGDEGTTYGCGLIVALTMLEALNVKSNIDILNEIGLKHKDSGNGLNVNFFTDVANYYGLKSSVLGREVMNRDYVVNLLKHGTLAAMEMEDDGSSHYLAYTDLKGEMTQQKDPLYGWESKVPVEMVLTDTVLFVYMGHDKVPTADPRKIEGRNEMPKEALKAPTVNTKKPAPKPKKVKHAAATKHKSEEDSLNNIAKQSHKHATASKKKSGGFSFGGLVDKAKGAASSAGGLSSLAKNIPGVGGASSLSHLAKNIPGVGGGSSSLSHLAKNIPGASSVSHIANAVKSPGAAISSKLKSANILKSSIGGGSNMLNKVTKGIHDPSSLVHGTMSHIGGGGSSLSSITNVAGKVAGAVGSHMSHSSSGSGASSKQISALNKTNQVGFQTLAGLLQQLLDALSGGGTDSSVISDNRQANSASF